MRVAFGGVVATAPLFANETHVIVAAPWGYAGFASVTISLNAQQFSSPAGVEFEFVGLHAPELLGAAFGPAGTQLVLTFDSQPTNRGGMAGVAPCTLVLDAATVATIRGD